MRYRPWTAALLLASPLLLPLTAPMAHAAEAPAVAIDGDFKAATQADALLSARDLAPLKGLKRVAIGQFNIEFVTQDSVSAQTSGFASAGRSSVSGFYKLVGLGPADFQAVADALHGRFVQQLRAGGVEVVEQAQVAAAPTWRKLVGSGTPLPDVAEKTTTVGLPGGAMYGVARAAATTTSAGLLGSLTAIGAGIAAVGNAADGVTLQDELGSAALLELTMQVHFAQMTNHNKGFFGRLGDTARVSATVHPVVTRARVSVQTGSAMSTIDLKQPLLLDAEAFSELRTQAKTAGDMAGAAAVGLLRLAIGTQDSHSSETYEAVTEPVRYRERVGGGLATVGELFVTRIAAAR